MISDARKKVLLDLFGSPWVILPALAGFTGLILGWATSPGWFSGMCHMGGFISLLLGGGIFATRLALSGGSLVKRQKQYEHEESLKVLTEELDALDKNLVRDRDSRTQNCLREIRHLYENLQVDVREGKIASHNYAILTTIEDLFRACVSQLKQTFDLWEAARKMTGEPKTKTEEAREKLLQEVLQAADQLGIAVKQFHMKRGSRNRQDLSRLTDQLNTQIDAARRVDDEKRRLLSGVSEQDAEFEQYMNKQGE